MYGKKSKRFLKAFLKNRNPARAGLGSCKMVAAWFDDFMSVHSADFH